MTGLFCGRCGEAAHRALLGDRYQLRGVIGAGWAGRVMTGFDPVLDRPVAIRLLSGSLVSDAAVWASYRQALGRAAGLANPHCVSVYAVTGDDPAGFGPAVIMELVEGSNLGRVRGSLDAEACVYLMEGALRGLVFLHAHGIAHGRVTPANLLVSGEGESKLADAGLPLTPGSTAARQVCATEQLRGNPPSAAGDVFAAAASMWLVLSGQPPFGAGDLPDHLRSRRAEPSGGASIPDPVRAVLGTALRLDETARPDTIRFHQMLVAAADQSMPKWREGATLAAAAVGIAAGASAGAAAGASAAGGTVAVGTTAASTSTVVATTGTSAGLFGSVSSGAVALVTAGVVATAAVGGGMYAASRSHTETPPPVVSSMPQIGPTQLLATGLAEAGDVPGDEGSFAFSRAADKVVFHDFGTGGLRVSRTSDRSSLSEFRFDGDWATASSRPFSPDGRRLLLGWKASGEVDDGAYLVDAAAVGSRWLTGSDWYDEADTIAAHASEGSYAPDGSRIAYRRVRYRGDTSTGAVFTAHVGAHPASEEREVVSGNCVLVAGFSPNGREVACGTLSRDPAKVRVLVGTDDTAGKTRSFSLPVAALDTGAGQSVGWSYDAVPQWLEDGRLAARAFVQPDGFGGSGTGDFFVWNAQTGQRSRVSVPSDAHAADLAPNGELLAYVLNGRAYLKHLPTGKTVPLSSPVGRRESGAGLIRFTPGSDAVAFISFRDELTGRKLNSHYANLYWRRLS